MMKSRGAVVRRVRRGSTVPHFSPTWAGGVSVALVLGSCVAFTPVAGAAKQSSKTPVYIGSVLGTTGAFAGFDAPEHIGLETVVSDVNKAGGIEGHKLVYVNVDDNSQSTKFAPGIEQLLQEHKYLAVFLTPTDFSGMAAYTNAEHVITFGGEAPLTTTFNAAKYPYEFNMAPLETEQFKYVIAALERWSKTKTPKVGIVVDSTSTEIGEMTELYKLLKTKGITVLPLQEVTATSTDISLQLQQLETGGANIVYAFGNDSICTGAFEGVVTLGWKVQLLANANCLNSAVVHTIPSTVLPRVRYFAVASTLVTSDGKPRARMAAFDTAVHKADPTAAPGIAAVAADAVHDLQWAANKEKSVTESKVLKALNTMDNATIPTSTFFQEPNPRWSSTDHLMDRATFNDYYGMANVTTPPVTGLWKATTLLSVTSKKTSK
jgi:branched-chain amino acid transport system substrate-binding protein